MPKIDRASLMPLETYAKERTAFRAKVMAHKKHRQIALGAHLTLSFEDELTMRYQVQEMLRVERIFEEAGIHDELDAYNPLIPDGRNFKATMLLEYPDAQDRKQKLAGLIGVEDKVWVQVEGCAKVYAIADEDLERENEEKTSSVHFLRFELTEEMARSAKHGAALSVGVDHPNYTTQRQLADDERNALVSDLA
jgi:hypothetical protein